MNICTPGASDFGLYGKTGVYSTRRMSLSKCVCGKAPKIRCNYDCSYGSRETVYSIFCETCLNISGGATNDMAQAIKFWEQVVVQVREVLRPRPDSEKRIAAIQELEKRLSNFDKFDWKDIDILNRMWDAALSSVKEAV